MIHFRNSNMPSKLRSKSFLTRFAGVLIAAVAIGADGDSTIQPGSRVCVTGPEVAMQSGNRRIPVSGEFRMFQVRRLTDGWVHLTSDRSAGWVKKAEVIPFEKAEEHLTAILQKDPNLAWAKRWRAAARLDRKDFEAALADVDSLLVRDSTDVSALILKGRAQAGKGDFDAAIAELDKAISLAPSNTRAILARATARFGKKQLEKAEADFTEALRLDPNDVEAHMTRGIVHREQGRIDEAIADFDTAVNLAPQNARTFLERAIARHGKAQLDWALADLDEAVKLDPKSAEAFRNLSIVRFQLRDFAGALDAAETSVRLAPADTASLNHLAWVLSTAPFTDLRDGTKAVRLARKADEISGGTDADVKDTLAAALAEDGQFDEAQKVLAKALELYSPDDSDRPEAEKRMSLYKNRQAFRSDP